MVESPRRSVDEILDAATVLLAQGGGSVSTRKVAALDSSIDRMEEVMV